MNEQKFNLTEGKRYTLKNIKMVPGIGLNMGSKDLTYLGSYYSWCDRVIHTFGNKLSEESFERYNVWDEDLERIEERDIISKPGAIFGHRNFFPSENESEKRKKERNFTLKLME